MNGNHVILENLTSSCGTQFTVTHLLCLIHSLKVWMSCKHELTKERDEKLSEIARVRVFYFIFLHSNFLSLFYILCEFSRASKC